MSKEEFYSGREQTLVKHYVLEKYLERFAHIIGSFCDTITYVDCFAGPWNVKSDKFDDSSFSIALRQLRQARNTHASLGKTVKLRCFFLEKDKAAFDKLQGFVASVEDAQIQCLNSEFEAAIDDIVRFVKAGGSGSFPLIFIDPKGWSGFAMDKIAPLLKLRPGEVLINFMTGHIRRFIVSPLDATRQSFDSLFGSGEVRQQIEGLSGADREDALIAAYAENVKRTGLFRYVCPAIVLHPEKDRTHFHLIYATRNATGVAVFKDAENKAMAVMESARAQAHQRRRQENSGQIELFPSDTLHDPRYYDLLRGRYTSRARNRILRSLQETNRLAYDSAWESALAEPLVWESDLRNWISEWKKNGSLRIEGLTERERVPKRGKNHILVWVDGGKSVKTA